MTGDDDDSDLWTLAGIGLWTLCLASAWANDDTDVSDVVEDQREFIVDALVKVRLLELRDGATHVPKEAFDKWTDRARQARNSARDRAARSRRTSANSGEVQRGAREEVEVEVELLGIQGAIPKNARSS